MSFIEIPVGRFVEANFVETCIETSVNILSMNKPVDMSIEKFSIEISVETYSIDTHSLEMSVKTHFKDTLVEMANLAGTYVETSE